LRKQPKRLCLLVFFFHFGVLLGVFSVVFGFAGLLHCVTGFLGSFSSLLNGFARRFRGIFSGLAGLACSFLNRFACLFGGVSSFLRCFASLLHGFVGRLLCVISGLLYILCRVATEKRQTQSRNHQKRKQILHFAAPTRVNEYPRAIARR